MKKFLLKNLMMAFCLFVANGLSAQVVVDFETAATSTVFGAGFGGGAWVGVVANPDPSGINTSANVSEYFEAFNPPPQCWAGCSSANPLPSTLDFVNYSEVCVKVYAPAPGNMLFKAEAPNMGGTWEQLQPIPVGGQWVEICFDGTQPDAASGGAAAAGRTFNIATLFFDFCSPTYADPTADKTWYFDDIIMGGTPPPPMGTYDVTFKVNMNGYAGSFGIVSVSGTFNGWHPNVDQLSDPDGDGIYEKTVTIPAGPILYKFQVDNWSGQEYFAPGSPCTVDNFGNWDRFYDVTDNVTLPAYCYSTCTVCPNPTVPLKEITFSVNMKDYPNPFTTVYLSGTFNGWAGTANPLSDINGDGVWSVSFTVLEGWSTEYKFQVDGWSDQEFFDPALHGACTVTRFGFTNRVVTAGAGNEALPTYCFATCDLCPATIVPTMGEWAMFLFALIMLTMGVVYVRSMQQETVLAGHGTIKSRRSFPFNRANYLKAMKHALGLAVVGFAFIYLVWGEIVPADFVGMALTIPVIAYLIHLFGKEEQ